VVHFSRAGQDVCRRIRINGGIWKKLNFVPIIFFVSGFYGASFRNEERDTGWLNKGSRIYFRRKTMFYWKSPRELMNSVGPVSTVRMTGVRALREVRNLSGNGTIFY
jgi:predicted nucleic acid-binding Zn ribbon protein